MTSLTHKVLNWTEDKMIELDGTKKSDYVKAFGIGALEGFVDTTVAIGAIIMVKSWIDLFTKSRK